MHPLDTKTRKYNEDGVVWIENGKVFVRDPKGNGTPATLIPNDEIILSIDSTVFNHIVIVNSKNDIQIKIQEKIIEPSIKIVLSQDELYAYLDFKPGIIRSLKLKDQEPKNSLIIQTKELNITYNNLEKEKIYKKLSGEGITYGVDENIIESILRAEKEQRFIIAKGDPPIHGRDAYIEYLFDNQPSKWNITDTDFEHVDYRNMFAVNCVKQNDIIAIKHPCQEGRNGLSVKRKDILLQTPKQINIVAGKGIEITEDGTQARANLAGMPNMIVNGKDVILEVSETLQIDHDIDLTTGNISYSNDIIIYGNVSETMEVNSIGSVFIKGNVSFAKISALKNITIQGNVISSKIISGSSHLTGTFLSELKNIEKMLNLTIQLIDELMRKAVFRLEDIKDKGIGVLVKLLLNLKLKELPQTIFNLFLNAKKGAYGILNDIAFEMFESLKIFLGDCTTLKSLEEIINIKLDIDEKLCKYSSETIRSSVIINYALNSEISSDGSIIVVGNGCYNTKIHSQGEVIINGTFIGGEIYSEKPISLSCVGSNSGVKSLIETSSSSRISVRKMFEGNVIKIGHMSHRFKETEFAIDARLIDSKIIIK